MILVIVLYSLVVCFFFLLQVTWPSISWQTLCLQSSPIEQDVYLANVVLTCPVVVCVALIQRALIHRTIGQYTGCAGCCRSIVSLLLLCDLGCDTKSARQRCWLDGWLALPSLASLAAGVARAKLPEPWKCM